MEEFVRLVVPELQRRGLFRKEYTGRTLRDHLGLARPAHGSWKTRFSTPGETITARSGVSQAVAAAS
jgi:hypothetical protein